MFKKTKLSCLQKSIALLSRREYSACELKNKLSNYGYDIEEIEVTIQKLQQKKLQSNERFIEYITRKNSNKSFNKLNYELKQHNLTCEEKEAAKHSLEQIGSEYDRACNAWHKKFSNSSYSYYLKINSYEDAAQKKVEQNKYYQKQVRFLLSQGFSCDTAIKAIKDLNNNIENTQDE